jgi:tetratricopeptide (TPR) repeat protein/predicted Ser/Thr protein kinase
MLVRAPVNPEHPKNTAEGDVFAQTVTADGDSTPSPSVAGSDGAHLAPGDTLGRYNILELLGEGGMGMVYGAYDPDLDRKVAIKILRSSAGEGSASDAARARLLREARAMAKLNHANVITVYEVGTVGKRDFVAMEFVDGSTLADWLGAGGRDWGEVVSVFHQAGKGLAAAHRAGMIHRDFKPANVLLSKDGRVLVTDFGLARSTDLPVAPSGKRARADAAVALAATMSPSLDAITQTGALLGTPAYMAPEQHDGGVADHRSDQYSFSVALYEGLYGQRPFSATTLEELRLLVIAGSIPDEPKGSDVPAPIRRAVLRGLSVVPEERFLSMNQLIAALSRDPRARVRRLAFVGVAATALIAAAVAGTFAGRGSAKQAATPCSASGSAFDGVWDQSTKNSLREAFSATGGTVGDPAFESLSGALDDYRTGWVAMHIDTCKSENSREDEEAFHLRMGCLIDQRNQVRALTEVFAAADARAVENAVEVANGLPDVSMCGDLVALRTGLPAPKDEPTRLAVEQLRAKLAEADALRKAWQLDQARRVAEDAQQRAVEIGYKPVEAEALFHLGRVNADSNKASSARAALNRALLIALEHGHDEIHARALVALTELESSFSSDTDKARELAVRAGAALERYDRDPTLQARLYVVNGAVAVAEKNYDEALALFQKALAVYQRDKGGNPIEAVEVMTAMATVIKKQGNTIHALEMSRQGLATLEEYVGRGHPAVAPQLEVIGQLLRENGQFVEAREHFERARNFWTSPRGQQVLSTAGFDQFLDADGRRVVGRVVDDRGAPVAGAEVIVAEHIGGDGRYMYSGNGPVYDRMMGMQRATTDASGRFELATVRAKNMMVCAEHDSIGRSFPVRLVEGADADDVQLTLRPFGALKGRVTMSRGKVGDLDASAMAGIDLPAGVDVSVSEDGVFSIERLPAGRHRVMVGDHSDTLIAREVEVRPGELVEVALDIVLEGPTAGIVVRGERDADIGAAQVFLFPGKVDLKSGREVIERYMELSRTSRLYVGFTKEVDDDRVVTGGAVDVVAGDEHIEFDYVAAGDYSVCSIPITGDLKDPEAMTRISRHRWDLEVHCRYITVAESPEQQMFVVEVPPMKKLPTPVTD